MMSGAAATVPPPWSAATRPCGRRLLGIREAEELPQNLFGSARASALAAVDRRHDHNALIVADLSNDPTYAEMLVETFGPRVIGLQISRHGDGMNAEWRPVRHGHLPVYTIGRTYLLELFHAELQSDLVRFADGPMMRRAYEQLANLELEYRESGAVYTCPPGNTMTSASPARCWPGRHGIRIWRHGSGIWKSPAGLAARGRSSIGQPLHNPA